MVEKESWLFDNFQMQREAFERSLTLDISDRCCR